MMKMNEHAGLSPSLCEVAPENSGMNVAISRIHLTTSTDLASILPVGNSSDLWD